MISNLQPTPAIHAHFRLPKNRILFHIAPSDGVDAWASDNYRKRGDSNEHSCCLCVREPNGRSRFASSSQESTFSSSLSGHSSTCKKESREDFPIEEGNVTARDCYNDSHDLRLSLSLPSMAIPSPSPISHHLYHPELWDNLTIKVSQHIDAGQEDQTT